MALERLLQLEGRIHESHDLNPQQKEELLQLLGELKEAMAEVSVSPAVHTHGAMSVSYQSASEGTRQDTPQHPVRIAMDDLSTSVQALEASHPEFVNTVNAISTVLANMGI
jgi:hypothetical protein